MRFFHVNRGTRDDFICSASLDIRGIREGFVDIKGFIFTGFIS